MKRISIKRFSDKKISQMREETKIRSQLMDRCMGKCEICGGNGFPFGLHPHEKKFRSLGGRMSLENSIMLCQACHGKQHRLNIKALLIPLAIIFLSSVSCMGTQDQRSYGQRLQEIIRKQDSILLKLSDLENLQNSTNDTMHVKLAETENGINLKIDRLSGLSPTDSSGKPIGIVEVRIYIIGDKWTQWRYCTNINDAITYLNNFK